MKFLQKYPVAILISILLIAFSILLGQVKHQEDLALTAPSSPESSAQREDLSRMDMSLSSSSYQRFIVDQAGIFSSEDKNNMALYNANLDKLMGGIVAVVTIDTSDGVAMDQLADDYFLETTLSAQDALLLLSIDDATVFLETGDDFAEHWSRDDAKGFVLKHLSPTFSAGDYSKAMDAFFQALYALRAEAMTATTVNPSPNSLGYMLALGIPALLFLLVVMLICTVADNVRYSRYHKRYGNMMKPPFVFSPIIFWHGPSSHWFLRRQQQHYRRSPGFGSDQHGNGFGNNDTRPGGGFGK